MEFILYQTADGRYTRGLPFIKLLAFTTDYLKGKTKKKVYIHKDCCNGKVIRPNYVHESKVLPRNASRMLKNGKYQLSFLGFQARIYISH